MRVLASIIAAASVLAAGPHTGGLGQPLADLHRAQEYYSALERDVRWSPLSPTARSVRAGDAYPDVEALGQRLVAFGDLEATTPASGESIYSQALSDGVSRFQRRHSLDVDGILGPQTLAELNVPLTYRVRQLEHAIGVLDGLTVADDARSIVVAVPLFRLWAWRGAPWRSAVELETRVIVGRPRTPTPEFTSVIESVTFRPFWTVPVSITAAELVPAIRKDPAYLATHGFEIVRPDGNSVAYAADVLPALASGSLRMRQRPGPDNALGLIRFNVPNPHGVFLHDTPARQLFAQTSRALSHGCVRVEDPSRLAEWALTDESWDEAAVTGALSGPDNRRVPLADPVRIHVLYLTAIVTPEGSVHFGKDIYRRLNLLLDSTPVPAPPRHAPPLC
jgi:murein L,D-transpeptidase YcbB/YkuD